MTAFGLPVVLLVYISEQQCPGRLGARFIKGSPSGPNGLVRRVTRPASAVAWRIIRIRIRAAQPPS